MLPKNGGRGDGKAVGYRVKAASRPAGAKDRMPRQYVVRVIYAPAGEDDDRALVKARKYVFARVLEKMRSEKGERIW